MHSPGNWTEHFVTLFDSKFLLLGLALHASLKRACPNARLWVICVDDLVERQIIELGIDSISTIPLRDIETRELLEVKPTRGPGEYCWTLTPFAPAAVFKRAPDATRVTYLDSDLFFFADPAPLFEEFNASGKHVLITEHAYAPNLDRSALSGRFCVQFMTFCRSKESESVMKWWQDRCVEWCFDRYEDGKFGDQKYLDSWPHIFSNEVHVVRQVEKLLAPWNVDFMLATAPGAQCPIFYHFQSFRIVADGIARLYSGVRIGKRAKCFYDQYLEEIARQIRIMEAYGIKIPIMPEPKRRHKILRKMYMKLTGKTRYAELPKFRLN